MATVEERLLALESELRDVKRRLTTGHNWLQGFVGDMADFPEFDEVIRLGREFRQSVQDAPEDQNGEDTSVHP